MTDKSTGRSGLTELEHGSYVEYVPQFLGEATADDLLKSLRNELPWEQREVVIYGKRIPQPRLISWAGALPYRYSGQTLEPRPIPDALKAVWEAVTRHCGDFNHVLLNRYRNGKDNIGKHSDNEPELGPDPTVAAISLGAVRTFLLEPRRKSPSPGLEFELEHGSLIIMSGACQRHYLHSIPKGPWFLGERISLTFRKILCEPGGRS